MGVTPGSVDPGALGPGPWRWIVTWGTPMRPHFTRVVVEAFDADDARSQGARIRPELPPPTGAFLARQDVVNDATNDEH
jgi:hypothetical protein